MVNRNRNPDQPVGVDYVRYIYIRRHPNVAGLRCTYPFYVEMFLFIEKQPLTSIIKRLNGRRNKFLQTISIIIFWRAYRSKHYIQANT